MVREINTVSMLDGIGILAAKIVGSESKVSEWAILTSFVSHLIVLAHESSQITVDRKSYINS
jgi:hypothetical protein